MPPDWRLLAASVKKQERVETIIRRLNEQYPETPIPLDHSDAFTLLIAVLLSAQCTDKKVNEVTPAGVTSLTFLSVHWALSSTAISSVKASL